MESLGPRPRRPGMETSLIVEPVRASSRREVRVQTRAASRIVSQAILLLGGLELFVALVLLIDAITPPITDAVALVASGVVLGAGPLAAFLTVLAIVNLIESGYDGFIGTLVAAIPVGVVISLVSAVFWLVIL